MRWRGRRRHRLHHQQLLALAVGLDVDGSGALGEEYLRRAFRQDVVPALLRRGRRHRRLLVQMDRDLGALALLAAQLDEGKGSAGERQHRCERDLSLCLAVPCSSQHPMSEERLALGGRARVQLQRARAEGPLDVLHHPEGLEPHHPPGALGKLGHHLADPVGVLEGLEGPEQHLHHPAPHLRDEGGLQGLLPEDHDREPGERRVVRQGPQQLGHERCIQIPHRQHHVHRRGAELGQRPAEVRHRPEPDLGTGEGLGKRAGRLEVGVHREERELRHGQPVDCTRTLSQRAPGAAAWPPRRACRRT